MKNPSSKKKTPLWCLFCFFTYLLTFVETDNFLFADLKKILYNIVHINCKKN